MFQLLARAELVVHARVEKGTLKYALVDVVETIRGESPDPKLRIAFRHLNLERGRGEESMVFPDGQDEILFLVRQERRREKEKHRDIYELFRGRQGRITLPAEGAGILLEALRTLAGLVDTDASTQVNGLLGLLDSRNPYLLESALDEVLRLRAATAADLPTLVKLLARPAPSVRLRSLQAIGQVFGAGQAEAPAGASGPDQARITLEAVVERARNDEVEAVRIEAVTTMSIWPRTDDIEPGLRAIASQDPDQLVRYQAERALFRLGLSR